MPAGAFFGIALAWFLAVVVGTWVAVAIARARPRLYAGIVGGLIALSAALNFALIPHPAWFVVLGLGAVLTGTLVGARLAARRLAGGR
jgi:ABC-type spermidine/putrescine transport system permease subunit I